MATVYCAAVECRHNVYGECCAPEISLSDGHAHTVHQGFLHHWICNVYEESEIAKEIRAYMQKILKERTEENEHRGGD